MNIEKIKEAKIENNNSKSQINYKNINTIQTNHNKKYIQYIKPLLFLLQKAEQIINIINLPSSSIDKYNQLKEISFKKCGLEFTPLIKNENLVKNIKKENININNQENNKENEVRKMETELSELKNRLIESLLNLIETSKDNNSYISSFKNFSNICNNIKEEISKISSKNEKINSEKEQLLNYITRSEKNIIPILLETNKKLFELKESFIISNSKLDNIFKYINNIDELIKLLIIMN